MLGQGIASFESYACIDANISNSAALDCSVLCGTCQKNAVMSKLPMK